MSAARPAIVTFYSYKGGVGRTLLAANMAVSLAARGKTLLWDLDVEAPGMHRIRALKSERAVSRGFFDWLLEWQPQREQGVAPAHLEKFSADICRTPFSDLFLMPAHSDDADAARLYFGIDWHYLLGEDPARGRDLFDALFAHLHLQGFRHVVLDSRTGLTDLGALIAGILPDATVLVGGYSSQNLGGLSQAWKALKRDDAPLKELRQGRIPPELFLVASPIPQSDAKLVAAGQQLWARTFGLELSSVYEIPFDPELPFSEDLLIGQEQREIARAYRKLAGAIEGLLDRRDEGERAETEQIRARPDVFGDRDGNPRLEGGEAVKTFEEQVAHLFELLGYTVEPALDDDPPDFVARIQSGLDVTTYLVECKDRSGAVGKGVVENVAKWLDRPAARAMAARGMVVARSFAPAAEALAKERGVRLFTPADLERQLVDFGPYLADQIAAFEGSTLAGAYVTQKARGSAGDKSAESKSGAGDGVIQDLVGHGLRWADGEGNRLWVVLGDYGTGKTAFTQKLSYELAKRATSDSDAPVPLLINLRDVPNKASLEDVLHEHWQRVSGQRKDPEIFLHLVERGRLTLLLDSFDEMGVATAGRSVVDELRSLVRVAGQAGESPRANRVLITCREQFFREHGEAVQAARGEGRVSELHSVALSFNGAIDSLERFTQDQVREFLVKRLGTAEGERAAAFLRKHYLSDLADRPQLLDIIIKSLPRLAQMEATGGKPVTTGSLYEAYTTEWLEDFKPRERQSSSAQLRAILEMLAGVLWGRAGNRIHYGDLYLLFKDRPDLRGRLDPQQLDIELRTAAFLSRTPDGHYGFSHRSFLEYFLARRIQHSVGAGDVELRVLTDDVAESARLLADVLDAPRISAEVCDFVDDLVEANSPERNGLRATLHRLLTQSDGLPRPPTWPSRPAVANALWLAYRLERSAKARAGGSSLRDGDRYIPDMAYLWGIDVSELVLNGIELKNAVMINVTAVGTSFNDAVFDGANLSGAVMRRASLMRASLRRARLDGADCTDIVATDANCDGARAARSTWINAKLDRANLDSVDFEGADLRGACLAGARGRSHKGLSSFVDAAKSTAGATARGATGIPTDLVEPPVDRLTPWLLSVEGHHDSVLSVAWSADSTRLATSSNDNSARVWDAASGALLVTLEGHSDGVRSINWSPDGARLASGSDDGSARIWDATSGALLLTLDHVYMVGSVAWSPDGTGLATGSEDGSARIWNTDSGALLRTFDGYSHRVGSVAWAPDGTRIATGSHDTARVWDAASGTLLRALDGHRGSVVSVAWSPDNTRLATGMLDSSARLWDVASGALLRTLEGHRSSVRSVAWSPDSTRLATGSLDSSAHVWDAASGALLRTLEGHRSSVRSIAWSPDGSRLATGSEDNTACVWDVDSGAPLRTLGSRRNSVRCVAWSPDGAHLAIGSSDNPLRIWGAASGALRRILQVHRYGVYSVAWSPDGTRLATGSHDTAARILDADTGALLLTLAGHHRSIRVVAWSPDGTRLATGGTDSSARLWDAASGALLRALEGHRYGFYSVAWSPDSTRLAAGSHENSARLWDAASGALLRTLEGHRDSVLSVAWSPDGTRLATGSDDYSARIWDATSGAPLRTLEGHRDGVRSVAWSPDGTRLATSSQDNSVRLWDAVSGALFCILEGHRNPVLSVAWSPDGTRIATGSDDNSVRIWNAATGAQLLLTSFAGNGFVSLDFEKDPRGLWRGEGQALDLLFYRDKDEQMQPSPWIPRSWRAIDLPELRAPEPTQPRAPRKKRPLKNS